MEVDERGLWLLVELASSWLDMVRSEELLSRGVWKGNDAELRQKT